MVRKKKVVSRKKSSLPAKKRKPVSEKKKSRSKKLKIAQIHWGFPPIIGGVETHLALMLPEMVKRGHKVSLLTGSVEGVPLKQTYEGVKISRNILMDLNWLVKRGLAGLNKEVDGLFRGFIENAKPDIIHVHNMHYFSATHTKVLKSIAKEKGIPLILTAHNVWDDVLYLELTRRVEWDHIIAVSHFIKREMMGIGVDDNRITTIHHGIDENKFKPSNSPASAYKKYPQLKNKRIIFHPARIGLGKGCDVSIKAMNLVVQQFPDAILVMAGNKNIIDWSQSQHKDIAYFVNLINHFEMEDNILLDSYSLNEMPALYAASDVAIYPSTAQEPFGLTMLEANASGKPMIVTKTGGMPEIISEGINGFVVEVKDYEALAGNIIRILHDPKLEKRLGNTGRQIVLEKYTKSRMTDFVLDVYDKVLF